jgi:hypothetical protein
MIINKQLLTMLEMRIERQKLKSLGLSNEEINGYFDYYIDNYLKDLGITKE